jgi:hypothetical protein
MRQAAAQATLAALLLGPVPGDAQSCPPLAEGSRIESERFLVEFRAEPGRIPVGQHFALVISVCPKDSSVVAESVKVDAHMPEHRHGMNYSAAVSSPSAGHYRAEGLMFHMPGRWELIVDVRSRGKTDRLTRAIVVE